MRPLSATESTSHSSGPHRPLRDTNEAFEANELSVRAENCRRVIKTGILEFFMRMGIKLFDAFFIALQDHVCKLVRVGFFKVNWAVFADFWLYVKKQYPCFWIATQPWVPSAEAPERRPRSRSNLGNLELVASYCNQATTKML